MRDLIRSYLNGLMVFPHLKLQPEFCNKELMIWVTVSSWSCFCWLNSFSFFGFKKYNQSDFSIDYLVMSMCRVISWVVGKGYLVWPACSLEKTVSHCPSSFCTPEPKFPVIPGISWLPTLHSKSLRWKGHLHRTGQLQLLQHQLLGHRLGLLWWMVCLGNEPRSFFIFQVVPKYCILDSFVDYEGYSISSKGFFPRVVDSVVIWIKFAYSSPF